jgi:hypothetical protein
MAVKSPSAARKRSWNTNEPTQGSGHTSAGFVQTPLPSTRRSRSTTECTINRSLMHVGIAIRDSLNSAIKKGMREFILGRNPLFARYAIKLLLVALTSCNTIIPTPIYNRPSRSTKLYKIRTTNAR